MEIDLNGSFLRSSRTSLSYSEDIFDYSDSSIVHATTISL